MRESLDRGSAVGSERFVRIESNIEEDDWGRWIGRETGKRGDLKTAWESEKEIRLKSCEGWGGES